MEQDKNAMTAAVVTVLQAAKYLSLSRSSIYNLMEKGELPYVKIGRARRIPTTALENLISENLTGGWKLSYVSQK